MKLFLFLKCGMLCLISTLILSCNQRNNIIQNSSEEVNYNVFERDSIVDHVMYSVNRLPINSEKRRVTLDSAIAEYPSIAYFQQQRAMPLYKQDKDELGKPFLEKAAKLDPQRYLDYKAFMECVFSQNYRDAISDFEKYLEMFGEGYVMDHTYYFYMGISYLQLNEFEKGKIYLDKSIAQIVAESGQDWVHHLDLMYLGIANLELNDYENAIKAFDEALVKYPSFGDVKFYKAICLFKLGNVEEANKLLEDAKEDVLAGNTINEDNVIYERYPYQVRRTWFGHP
ncbi:tetratricopeptide repeat protein [Aequorivita capsosiphonis]|uniref:tetratricopeptide repeat protein n=1 Tax=Aequorivita capsosiphonis TaxID=487317 RepID=UPI001FDF1640|nr:tetratricopeptide repeat protein [Aequorivita capsosiphonis]